MSNRTDPKKNDVPVSATPAVVSPNPDSNEMVDQLKEEQKNWEAQYQRIQYAWATAAAILTISAMLLRTTLFGNVHPPSYGLMAAIAVAVWFCGFIIVVLLEKGKTDKLKNKINRFKSKAKRNEVPTDTAEKYFSSLATSNLKELKDYYGLVEKQSDNSFKNASRVGILGFLLIVGGVAIGLIKGADAAPIAYITSASGVLTEFISAVFFVIYNRSVTQLKDYHKNLVDLQNLFLAFKITDDVEDKAERIKLTSKIIECLTTITPPAKTDSQSEPARPANTAKPS